MKKKRTLMGNMVQIVLRVTPEVDKEIQAIVRRECRSYSSVVRQAISEYLEGRKRGRRRVS